MLDIQNSLAHPLVIRREDYTPPEWLVPETKLEFDLDPSTTRVTATLSVMRNGDHAAPLRLDGAGQKPLSVTVDGVRSTTGGSTANSSSSRSSAPRMSSRRRSRSPPIATRS